MYEGVLQDLIDELARLPGVGPKGAQRIAFHLLAADPDDVRRLAESMQEMKAKATFCQTDRLSNRAAPWNSIPNRAMKRARSSGWPFHSTCPASGRSSPRIHFSRTDLPVPDWPMKWTTSCLSMKPRLASGFASV